MVDFKLKKSRFDWILMTVFILLILIGTVSIISSTVMLESHYRLIRTQILAIAIGIFLLSFFWVLNYQIFNDQYKYVYSFSILILLGVLFFGVVDKGSRSWYRLPFFSIQPSEFARIGIILFLSSYLSKNYTKISEFSYFLFGLFLFSPFVFLFLKQPDFSGILITMPVVLGMFYVAGANAFHIMIFATYVFVSSIFPFLWTIITLNPDLVDNSFISIFFELADLGWNTIIFILFVIVFSYFAWKITVKFKPFVNGIYFGGMALIIIAGFITGIFVKKQIKSYQYKRIEVFLSPQKDPRGAGYNLLQARIAIGSGGLLGKGFFSGTQARFGFVPERHTDFIISVVGEEAGFLGLFFVMSLYAILLYRIKKIAIIARDNYGYFICVGFFFLFLTYFTINLGMILGFLPVAGIPLPMLSYGGSNLVSMFIIIGILQSIYSRRYSIV